MLALTPQPVHKDMEMRERDGEGLPNPGLSVSSLQATWVACPLPWFPAPVDPNQCLPWVALAPFDGSPD